MSELIHQLISHQAIQKPDAVALLFKDKQYSYAELQHHIASVSNGLMALGLNPDDRVATYLPKLPETVFSLFGAAQAGGVFVPINPLLKSKQVAYILDDCDVKVLITSAQRLQSLVDSLDSCHQLHTVIVVEDELPIFEHTLNCKPLPWPKFVLPSRYLIPHSRIDADMTAILYTSGSTGNPKGVVLSHKNMATGAKSVASYLNNVQEDCLLAALPFSFDYGLSQLTTAFSVGASVVLMDYLLPQDVIRAIQKYNVTGLAAVPSLWNQLVRFDWPEETAVTLRYLTNSGGAMPQATTEKLRAALPNTQVFLMYGLTEAFRSTYLPPDQIDIRPTSIGKAIPNAQILVVRPDGTECEPDEAGELVHRGSLVAMGYWNDPAKTAQRFKLNPAKLVGIPLPEIAVWSGDQVKRDKEGFLYFISRMDEMIKTSGYRVSPSEVEEVIYGLPKIKEVAAIGLPHPALGQAILLVVTLVEAADTTPQDIIKYCKKGLPNFMVPQQVILLDSMPHNQNGKVDRKLLASEYSELFQER